MSDSYWLPSVALGTVGLTVLVYALVGAAGTFSDHSSEQQYTTARDHCAKQQAQHAGSGVPLDEMKETAARNQSTGEEKQAQPSEPDWCDLAAQQSMAKSTAGMERAAWISTAISIAGLFMLGATLHYTRHAAEAARHSVETQLRIEQPLIWVSDISIKADPAVDYLEYETENIGKSPAILMAVSTRAIATREIPVAPTYTWENSNRGAKLDPKAKATGTAHIEDADLRGTNGVLFYGRFKCEDTFGRTRIIGFGYHGEFDIRLRRYSWSRVGARSITTTVKNPKHEIAAIAARAHTARSLCHSQPPSGSGGRQFANVVHAMSVASTATHKSIEIISRPSAAYEITPENLPCLITTSPAPASRLISA